MYFAIIFAVIEANRTNTTTTDDTSQKCNWKVSFVVFFKVRREYHEICYILYIFAIISHKEFTIVMISQSSGVMAGCTISRWLIDIHTIQLCCEEVLIEP